MEFKRIVKALYDYEAEDEYQLPLREKEIIYITNDEDPEWWKGTKEIGGLELEVPYNYVEEIDPLFTVSALFDYELQNDEELSFKEGEVLCVYQNDDEWLLAKNDLGFGFIPSNYVQEVYFWEFNILDCGGRRAKL